MKKKRLFVWLIVIACIVLCAVFVIFSGKLRDTYNEYDVTYSFFDSESNYVSALDFSFNLETKATYKEIIRMRSDAAGKLYIAENALSDDIQLRIKDKKSHVLFERALAKDESQIYISEDEYTGGEYILELTLPGGCTGTLEIVVDEQ